MTKRIFTYWMPVIIWMILIFTLSAQTKVAIGKTYWQDFFIKKTLHFIEYATFYFLLFRLFFTSKTQISKRDRFLMPLIIGICYAITDEIHQTFVPTREGTLRDVFIDTLGMSCMFLYIRSNINKIRQLL